MSQNRDMLRLHKTHSFWESKMGTLA